MVSDGKIGVDVEVTGAAESEEKLKKVAKAAKETGESAGKAGGLFSRFEQATRSLDDAVDKVEKPMRTFSGALDIASVALGVGLAGPLGQVIQQFIELGKGVIDAALNMDEGGRRAEQYAARLKKVGEEARVSASLVKAYEDVLRSQQGGVLTPEQQRFATEQALARQKNLERLTELQKQYASSVATEGERQSEIERARQREAAAGGAINLRVSETVQSVTGAYRQQKLESDRLAESIRAAQVEEQRFALAESELQRVARERVEAEKKKTAAIVETTAATARASSVAAARDMSAQDAAERRRKEDEAQLLRLRELGKEAAAAIADINAANDRAALAASLAAAGRTVAGFVPGLKAVGAAAASGVGMVGGVVESAEAVRQEEEAGRARRLQAALDGDAAASLAIQLEQQGAALKANFSAVTQSALDLQSLGVSAVKGFADAVGQALANLIITGGKFGQSFKKVAGEVAASLASQSLSYSVFLGAAAVASAFSPGLLGPWWNPATLGAAAAAMAAVGVTLGLTARALGAGRTDSPSGGGSAGAGGGGDRTASYSAPGQSSPSMNVTVVLGVEQVSDVLVRQSQRESRSGSLASSRLAVA